MGAGVVRAGAGGADYLDGGLARIGGLARVRPWPTIASTCFV
jgi:hypothetical protein